MLDGFQAFCTAPHEERNVMLAHYFTKKVKRAAILKADVSFEMGRTKHGYLNSLMRAQKKHGLMTGYVDWACSKALSMKISKLH